MNIEEYNKETGCIECKQVVAKNLVEIISWQREKLEKIEELCKELMSENEEYASITQILKIIRGEE